MDIPDIPAVKNFLLGLQDQICGALEKEDGAQYFVGNVRDATLHHFRPCCVMRNAL